MKEFCTTYLVSTPSAVFTEISIFNRKEKIYICVLCENMSEDKLNGLKRGPPKIRMVHLCIMIQESIADFMKPGGTYEKNLWKMFRHKVHIKLLGSNFAMKMMYDFSEQNKNVLVCKTDYSEKYQPTYMGEIQSEHFGKDDNVSMEIRIVTYNGKFDGPESGASRRVLSYIVLSADKPQIAATSFVNTQLMIEDIMLRKELNWNDPIFIILISDGCAGQYRSGTALYFLRMQAQSYGKIILHVVRCAGHGKCR